MKKLYFLIPLFALVFVACTKKDYVPGPVNVNEWMRTHDHGVVAYVDYASGYYVVETYNGYSVIESWDGSTPIEYDHTYAYFNNRGVQTIYNRSGDYFTEGRVIESWLTWNEAMYIIEDLTYGNY